MNLFVLQRNSDEISKHMADLSSEFEDLFDPYLPIASKLKMKTCPGMGVSSDFLRLKFILDWLIRLKIFTLILISIYQRIWLKTIEFCEAEPGFTIDLPSSYHGKWKVSGRGQSYSWKIHYRNLIQSNFRFELGMTKTSSWPRMTNV